MSQSMRTANNVMERARDRLRDLLESGSMLRPETEEFMEILIDELSKEKAVPAD